MMGVIQMSELDGCYVSETVLSMVQNTLDRNEISDLIRLKDHNEVGRYGVESWYTKKRRRS